MKPCSSREQAVGGRNEAKLSQILNNRSTMCRFPTCVLLLLHHSALLVMFNVVERP